MKRFHVHISVDDLAANIQFYSSMFGAAPTVTKPDYAKWMLDNPRVNFAISQRGHAAGVNHLGFQVDSNEELSALRGQIAEEPVDVLDETDAACCYAQSNKYWIRDPQGIAWETFHTLNEIPVFGAETTAANEAGACCVPLAKHAQDTPEVTCCVPKRDSKSRSSCCS